MKIFTFIKKLREFDKVVAENESLKRNFDKVLSENESLKSLKLENETLEKTLQLVKMSYIESDRLSANIIHNALCLIKDTVLVSPIKQAENDVAGKYENLYNLCKEFAEKKTA